MDATYTTRIGNAERRHRLATNDNEIVVDDAADDQDVEGHRLATNDAEIVIDGVRPADADEPGDVFDGAGPSGFSNDGH